MNWARCIISVSVQIDRNLHVKHHPFHQCVCGTELMSKHVTGLIVYAGMQVSHSGQWEAGSARQSGLLPILLITHENEGERVL